MNGMAVGADHPRLGMDGLTNIGARKRFAVTSQAGLQRLFGREHGERDNGCLAAVRLHVRFAGTMAALAFVLNLGMRILVKLGPHIRVAGSANIAPDVIRRGGRRMENEREHTGEQHSSH